MFETYSERITAPLNHESRVMPSCRLTRSDGSLSSGQWSYHIAGPQFQRINAQQTKEGTVRWRRRTLVSEGGNCKMKKKTSGLRRRLEWIECLFVKHPWSCLKDSGVGCETTSPLAGSKHNRICTCNLFQVEFFTTCCTPMHLLHS